MMKVTYRKQGKPSALVVPNTMHQKKRGSQLAVQFSGDGIHHVCRMNNGEKSERARHLFFGEISAGHVHHCFPVGFDQPVCRLTTSRSGHHVGIVVGEVVPNALPEQFGVTIRPKASSIGPSIGFEVAKGQENGVS
jgi:hypothetical protein